MQKLSFKAWLWKEYYDNHPELMGHPSWQLALEIDAKWPDFPDDFNKSYLELALFLAEHGACNNCKKAFRDAYENYRADIGY